jgi:hypothetical protein
MRTRCIATTQQLNKTALQFIPQRACEAAMTMLANGYFSRHPLAGFAVIFILFGLAGAVAPCADLLLAGGL